MGERGSDAQVEELGQLHMPPPDLPLREEAGAGERADGSEEPGGPDEPEEAHVVEPPSEGDFEATTTTMAIPDPPGAVQADDGAAPCVPPPVPEDTNASTAVQADDSAAPREVRSDDEPQPGAAERWEEHIELYLQRLEEVESSKGRVQIFKQIAEVFLERLNDHQQATDALVEALALDPFDNGTVDALEQIARAHSAWSPLIVSTDEAMKSVKNDRDRETKLCEHLVRWYEGEKGAPELAAPYRERIRKLDPKHPLVQQELAASYYAQGQYALARDALKRAIDGARRKDRAILHLGLGTLYEHHLGDPGEAQKAYEAAQEIAPESHDALMGLERIYRALEKFRELEGVLGRLATSPTESAEDRAGALMRLAELNEKHFLRYDVAAQKLEEVLAFDPAPEGALAALERCQRAMRAWSDLTATLDQRAEAAGDPSEKAEVLFRRAEVEESKLGDLDAAVATYERILRLDDRATLPLNELARLSEKKQDWPAAAAYRAKLAGLQSDGGTAAQLLVQIGDMLAQPGRNPESARGYYERALALVPSHPGAWEALQRDAERSGDGERIVYCLEQRVQVTEASRMRAQLLVELARQRKQLGNDAGAFAAYEEAIRADSTNELAAASVLPVYAKESRWQEAAPLCELLVNAATRDADRERSFALLRLAARIATRMGDGERALTAALAAFELSPSSLDGRRDVLATLHALLGNRAQLERGRAAALRISDDSQDLPPPALVQLAELEHAFSLDDRALDSLSRALADAPTDPDALRAAATLYEARGDLANAAGFKLRLGAVTEDLQARYRLFVDAGDMLAQKVKDLAGAAAAYEMAVELNPRDSWLLHTMMQIYGELEAWEKLVETLRAIVELDRDPVKKAKGVFTMAQVVGEKIRDPYRATELYEETIGIDPSRLDAFERVVRICTETKDWDQLEKSYRLMIHRTPDQELELRHALFHQLGLIYRDRIGDAERAIEAFRAAGMLKPGEENRKILTELYVVTNRLDAATKETREALAEDASSVALYTSLYELFLRAHAYDKAWCAVSVLAHLGVISPEQRKFFDDYPPTPLTEVPATLGAAAWESHLLQRELDPTLTAIFRIMAMATTRARAAALTPEQRAAALGEPLRAEMSYNAGPLLEAVRCASEILGVPVPALFARKGPPSPLAIGHVPTPTLCTNTEALDTLARESLAFLVGKRLAELRPELLGRAVFPSVTEMTAALATAVRLAKGERALDAAAQRTDAQIGSGMTPEERATLNAAVSQATAAGTKLDVKGWSQKADAASSRVGLLLCGQLDAARRAILQVGQSASDLPPRQRVQQLCVFAVSDEFAELRAAIGVGVRAT
jgi:tetratricopeptide (TPR) repeat protein